MTATPIPAINPAVPAATPRDAATAWKLAAFSGRLGEISGSHAGASLTFACRLIHQAQRRGEPVAWLHHPGSVFFPPDAAAAGIDLDALAVIRVTDIVLAAQAADYLLRSGGFGLVVLDLGAGAVLSIPIQSRLAGLARKHEAVLLCLTEKDAQRASLGPLISLRVETSRRQRTGNHFYCEARVLKDKRRGPGRKYAESCRGPDGLR